MLGFLFALWHSWSAAGFYTQHSGVGLCSASFGLICVYLQYSGQELSNTTQLPQNPFQHPKADHLSGPAILSSPSMCFSQCFERGCILEKQNMKGNKGLGPGAMFSKAEPVNCRWFLWNESREPLVLWCCSVPQWVSKAQAAFSVERFPKQLLLIPFPVFLCASSWSHHWSHVSNTLLGKSTCAAPLLSGTKALSVSGRSERKADFFLKLFGKCSCYVWEGAGLCAVPGVWGSATVPPPLHHCESEAGIHWLRLSWEQTPSACAFTDVCL